MQKIATYIQTIGSEIFKKFILQPFSINFLYNVTNEEGVNVIFNDWHGKDMGNWFKLYNEDHVVLEFYAGYYMIKYGVRDIQKLPLPKTINDFINDMDRFKVPLYWNQWIEDKFEPPEGVCTRRRYSGTIWRG